MSDGVQWARAGASVRMRSMSNFSLASHCQPLSSQIVALFFFFFFPPPPPPSPPSSPATRRCRAFRTTPDSGTAGRGGARGA